jgi:two-component system, OmpR family, sensor histidine kinase KdpD
MSNRRPRPEDFLELLQRARRGRLKLYVGFAAGVGKTYRMLEEAHALKEQGIDVVLGYIEAHGRPETEALVHGLEIVPRKKVEYRGVVIAEMDVDATVARRPELVVVDEIPHTNPPGSRNKKRYQDVLTLLDAGINVIAALNIQHLESLRDVIERTTDVVVRETVPDRFLKESDQVINLDLSVEDLLERFRAGKVYAQDKIEWALAHFFVDEHLSTLRELALREVAGMVEHASAQSSKPSERRERSTRSRVLVCLSSAPPHGAELMRRGSRMAGRLNTDWYVLFVERPAEAPERIDSEAQRHLVANIQLANDLGAEVQRIKAAEPVSGILDFARSHNVGDIIIGRSHQPWWQQVLGRSVPLRLVREASGFDVHIVSLAGDKDDR